MGSVGTNRTTGIKLYPWDPAERRTEEDMMSTERRTREDDHTV